MAPPFNDGGRVRRLRVAFIVLVTLTLAMAACGGDDDTDVATPLDDTSDDTGSSADESDPAGDDDDGAASTYGGTDACSLLDEDFLNETLDGQTTNFGDPFQFQAPLGTEPAATCSWKDSSGLSVQLTIEPTAEAETDDHSGRAYNIDEEPTVEPQDGPGEKAVLLIDKAFDDLGSDGFPYGYFFVEGDDTVFIETVGLDVSAAALRTFADEADRRLLAG